MTELLHNPLFIAEGLIILLLWAHGLRVMRKTASPGVFAMVAVTGMILIQVLLSNLSALTFEFSGLIHTGIGVIMLFWLSYYSTKFSPALIWTIALVAASASIALIVAKMDLSVDLSALPPLFVWMIFIAFNYIGETSTRHQYDIVRVTRPILIVPPLIFFVLIFVLKYNHFIVTNLLQIVITMLPFSVINSYDRILEEEDVHQINRVNQNNEMILGIISDLGNMILDRDEARKVNEEILHAAQSSAQSDTSVLMLVEDAREKLIRVETAIGEFPIIPKLTLGKKESYTNPIYERDELYRIEPGVLEQAFFSGESIIPDHGRQHEAFTPYEETRSIHDLMICPIRVSGNIYGIFLMARTVENRKFSRNEFRHVQSFLDFASISIQNIQLFLEGQEKRRALSESEIAGEIQQLLLPRRIETQGSIQLSVQTQVAQGVHSDYYDSLVGPGGQAAVILCDVAGRGMLSILAMTMIRATFHLIGGSDRPAGSILNWINRAITRRIRLDRFANMVYLMYNEEKHVIQYAGAAHQPMVVYRLEDGLIEKISNSEPPIGIDPRNSYKTHEIHVDSGDIIILYTDGLIETQNTQGIQFGYKNLIRTIMNYHNLDADSLKSRIIGEVEGFQGLAEQYDDRSLLVIKIS